MVGKLDVKLVEDDAENFVGESVDGGGFHVSVHKGMGFALHRGTSSTDSGMGCGKFVVVFVCWLGPEYVVEVR